MRADAVSRHEFEALTAAWQQMRTDLATSGRRASAEADEEEAIRQLRSEQRNSHGQMLSVQASVRALRNLVERSEVARASAVRVRTSRPVDLCAAPRATSACLPLRPALDPSTSRLPLGCLLGACPCLPLPPQRPNDD